MASSSRNGGGITATTIITIITIIIITIIIIIIITTTIVVKVGVIPALIRPRRLGRELGLHFVLRPAAARSNHFRRRPAGRRRVGKP
jgi:hypothetical protein